MTRTILNQTSNDVGATTIENIAQKKSLSEEVSRVAISNSEAGGQCVMVTVTYCMI